jgi:hypothetical protein
MQQQALAAACLQALRGKLPAAVQCSAGRPHRGHSRAGVLLWCSSRHMLLPAGTQAVPAAVQCSAGRPHRGHSRAGGQATWHVTVAPDAYTHTGAPLPLPST